MVHAVQPQVHFKMVCYKAVFKEATMYLVLPNQIQSKYPGSFCGCFQCGKPHLRLSDGIMLLDAKCVSVSDLT